MGDTEPLTLPFSTWEVTKEVAIRKGTGMAGQEPVTVMQSWDRAVAKNGDKIALHKKVDGKWKTWTWKEYRAQVDAFGKSLLSIGFERFDGINILGFNAPEWFMANYGAIAAGGVSSGIYSTNNATACHYISRHSKAKVVVCDGLHQLEKYYDSKDLPDLKALVVYGPDQLPEDVKDRVAVPVYSFSAFLELGKEVTDQDLAVRSNSWKPGEVCTLIYTSGTTGPPKAVMLTNDNITWTSKNYLLCSPRGFMDNTDEIISFLPLSHIAAQMLDMHGPLESGCQVWFAEHDALKGSLAHTIKEVRPTVFLGVPRVWEKFYEKLQEVGKSTTGLKKMLSTWAKGTVAAHWQSLEFGSKTKSPVFTGLARKILHQVHVALGFDRCQGFYVSAAPVDVEILKYFTSLDIPIMDVFGQSECSGPYTVNVVSAFKLGTSGRPMLGTEARIDPETGELQYSGRHIFAGYKDMPEETKAAIDEGGFLRSGDIATFDEDDKENVPHPSGFLTITGRIKELIITAGGENIPPVLIEDELKHAMPAVSNAMVVGDKRKFLSVLLTLKVEIDEHGIPTDKLTGLALDACAELGSTAKTVAEARDDPKWQSYFEKGLKVANEKAASKAQCMGKYTLLDGDFSEKGGELTPTLKLKRSVAAKKYADVIEALYAGT